MDATRLNMSYQMTKQQEENNKIKKQNEERLKYELQLEERKRIMKNKSNRQRELVKEDKLKVSKFVAKNLSTTLKKANH